MSLLVLLVVVGWCANLGVVLWETGDGQDAEAVSAGGEVGLGLVWAGGWGVGGGDVEGWDDEGGMHCSLLHFETHESRSVNKNIIQPSTNAMNVCYLSLFQAPRQAPSVSAITLRRIVGLSADIGGVAMILLII